MSPLKCVGGFARNRRTTKKERSLFQIWSRNESDNLRWRLLGHLGISDRIDDGPCDLSNQHGSYHQLCRLPEVAWIDSPDHQSLSLVQARAMFTKDCDMQSPVDKEKVAFESFIASERSCETVNDRFRKNSFAFNSDVASILHYARRKIATILGDVPEIADLDLTFGPGASTSCRKRTSARWKLSSPPSISYSALSILPELRAALPLYFAAFNQVRVERGELEFVPKNYKTDRAICIEPTVNGMVQKGIGTCMKRKLLRAGVNLYDQSVNQSRASRGSRDGSLCTIDLERASDSVSYMLVLELLPLPWFELLDSVRTPVVQYRKGNHVFELEKFSSMGNGYTFELESLIFYSLAYGIATHFDIPFDLTVYGDDIVTTPALFERIAQFYPEFGFNLNLAKSFAVGPFRESCGGDYVFGVDVRPYFLKDRFSYHRVICFYNFLTRKPWFDPQELLRVELKRSLPKRFLLYGPDGYGDGHLVTDDYRRHLRPHKRKFGYGGFVFDTFVAVPNEDRSDCVGDTLLPFYSAGSSITECDRYLDSSQKLESSAPNHYVLRSGASVTSGQKKVSIYVLDA